MVEDDSRGGDLVDGATIFLILIGVVLVISFITRFSDKLSDLEKLKSEQEALRKERQDLEVVKLRLDRAESDILRRSTVLKQRESNLNEQVRLRTIQLTKDISSRDYLSKTPVFSVFLSDAFSYDRILPALTGNMQIKGPFDIAATICSGSETYNTTLHSCDCPDYKFHHRPCKHMMRLGIEVGMLISADTEHLREDAAVYAESYQTYIREKTDATKRTELLRRLERTQDQTYPWLAELRADAYETAEAQWVEYLKSKNRPAMQKASEVGSIIHGALRQARMAAKQAEYQVHFYESLFPWLLDYKELPPLEAFSYTQGEDAPPEDEAAAIRQYLSPEDWFSLSEAERYQLVLDRYIARNKSNWEVGIEYERYIGYLCEKRGFGVTYNGARTKLEDMGRDLVLRRDGEVILVQCKRWASDKTVHENHVFQLAGSVFEYQYQHPEISVSGVLVTSTKLSDVANRCAASLGIQVYPGVPFQEYPRIKCNIGRDGSRIYHLPVDQQYDNVVIAADGEFYAATVVEAEAAGFRRAYRWSGSQQEKS